MSYGLGISSKLLVIEYDLATPKQLRLSVDYIATGTASRRLAVAVSVAFAWILWPFYGAMLWAVVFATVFAPAHRRVLATMRQSPNMAALMTAAEARSVGTATSRRLIRARNEKGIVGRGIKRRTCLDDPLSDRLLDLLDRLSERGDRKHRPRIAIEEALTETGF